MKRFLQLLLLVLMTCPAWANPMPTPDPAAASAWGASMHDACVAALPGWTGCELTATATAPVGSSVSCGSPGYAGPGTCYRLRVTRTSDGFVGYYSSLWLVPSICPAGYTFVSPSVECSGEGLPAVGDCPKPDNFNTAKQTSIWENLSENAAKSMARAAARGSFAECSNGCVIQRGLAACGGTAGVWRCEMSFGSATAKPCGNSGGMGFLDNASEYTPVVPEPAGDKTPTHTATPDPPSGLCPGEVNGVTVYVKCDKTMSPTTSTSTTSGGSGTTTVTAEGDTTCKDGKCTTTWTKTTTTTVTDGSGNTTSTVEPPKTTTEVMEQSEFCKKNPTASFCKDVPGNKVGGNCATFTCDGDAALCAIARATHAQQCMFEKPSDESALYTSVKGNTGTGIQTENIALSAASFSTENLLGTATCPPDKTIVVSILGQTKNLLVPFSQFCNAFEMLGLILVAIAWIISARIVFVRGS